MLKQINSIDTGLGKLLGYYPNIQHEMLHRNTAQQRPGYLSSAPQAFQKPQRAPAQANGCTASQRRQSQPGDTTATNDQPEPWTQHTSVWSMTELHRRSHGILRLMQPCQRCSELHPPQLDGHNTSARSRKYKSDLSSGVTPNKVTNNLSLSCSFALLYRSFALPLT